VLSPLERIDLDGLDLDEIGPWSIRKNDMVEYYAQVYADILGSTTLKPYYIDGFANRGFSRLRNTGEPVLGSALRVLAIQPPFNGYFFVELDAGRAADLQSIVGERSDVSVIVGDCNRELPSLVLPKVRWDRYERALCFLDPYNMKGLRWETILATGENEAVDAIIHFPTMDAHRTVLQRDESTISPQMITKMNAYWGDDTWRGIVYGTPDGLLPLGLEFSVKREPETVIEAFRKRLQNVAHFPQVSKAMPMRNRTGNIIYHLIFASHNKAAKRVMSALEKRFGQ
jgi:three-Cys-motif partner protein